ncbi:MAG: DNA polymerase III subunit delta' [Rhodospirillaceae bacterium]|jgi:DNA polymerase-3 subunit delta'|nr:DNA polymerase III subunit delta' [Rhodospirillaceae bacterium]MBT7770837.1 DNA polymerase III subunit delta' [Rhodospirillales bacterium]MBT4702047.1 DNA polymerase III subunit delta' [Rhodospirillaceae bacterium]MBT5033964.1 DNA polymerase III subunit delta' [Rhodospirillaceae bacterium]MBT6222083.1 DNA polymerase III subunit delta' [Rhodospirillaceae bacterium]
MTVNFDPDGEEVPLPRETSDLLGHEHAETALLNGFNSGRLAHAWLITGPRGIGKATLAYRFARFILANSSNIGGGPSLFGDAPPAPTSLNISPDNPIFHRVAGGGHSDLLGIERTRDQKTNKLRTVIRVEEVRQVGGFFGLTASEGGWRVVVIDAADEMNVNAANAVLKVLEEPPDRALLLLVSHNPGRLLPTIRSRCRVLRLNPLADPVVEDLIARYHPELSMDDRSDLVRLSDGSIGHALALADGAGVELYRDMINLIEALPSLDTEAVHKLGDKVARVGSEQKFQTLGNLLRWWLGRLVVGGAGKGGQTELMKHVFAQAGLDNWLEVWEKVNRILERTDAVNLDRKQTILNIFLTLERTVRT